MSKLTEAIKKCNNIVFFGGAGVSIASGIPDFRSADGIYSEKGTYSPEEILSHGFFFSHTKEFYKFYREKMLYPDAKPNVVHYVLAELEKKGKLAAVITQNIDGLHKAAGSNKVFELHGTVHSNYCTKCGKHYGIEKILSTKGIPYCECGGVIKPDVVLYGEALDTYMLEMANAYACAADMLIVGGTSLSVFPAASLVNNYVGNNLVLINKTPTSADKYADILIHDDIAAVFEEIGKDLN